MREIGKELGLIGDDSEKVLEAILETRGEFSAVCEGIIEDKLGGSVREAGKLSTKMKKAKSIFAFTEETIKNSPKNDPIDYKDFFAAFIARARNIYKNLFEKENDQKNNEDNNLFPPSKEICSEDSGSPEFFKLTQRNKFLNYLVLIGLLEPVPYDVLHGLDDEVGAYNFSTKQEQNLFAEDVKNYKNGPNPVKGIIEGKEVLSLGSGNGLDESFFLEEGEAKKVILVDSSPLMIDRQSKVRKALRRMLRLKFKVPREPQEMFGKLKNMMEKNKKVNTIYGHSVTHYFDDEKLGELFELVMGCLKKGGHFTFAVKAPGALHDGNGIPLDISEKIWIVDSGGKKRITTTTETEGIKIEPTRKVWLNDDGQVRFFRSIEELLRIIKKIGLGSEFGFNVKVQAIFTIEDYDIKDGGEQDFYRVILKKVPRREGANEKRTRRRK